MTVGSENNRKYVQQRTTRARKRAQFVGVLYFLGAVALAVLAFMPVLEEVSWKYGTLGVATFWKPFAELSLLLSSSDRALAAINLFVGFLYGLPLIVSVIGAFCSLSKLDNLYMKGNRRIGHNQSYIALKKMANTFSASYATISVCSLCLILLTGTAWTYLFYFASAGFLFLHFFCGLIGGTVSRFSLENGFVETPRKYGLFSVFFRNLLQFAAVTTILYFFVNINVIPTVFLYLEDGFFSSVSSMTLQEIVTVLGFPIAEVLMILFTIVILRHACNPTEFDIDGPAAKGRKTVRVASFIILLLSLAMNGFLFYFAEEKNFDALNKELLYISATALVLFVFECLLKKFPLLRKKYKNAAEPDPIPLEDLEDAPLKAAPAPTVAPVFAPPYCALAHGKNASAPSVTPVFEGLTQAGVYIQPDGSRVMVLPVIGNAAMEKPELQVVKRALTEHEKHVRAVTEKWLAAAKEGSETGYSSEAYVKENRARMQYEEPAPAKAKVEKEWRIRCPKCDALHSVTKTDGTVTCKRCGEKFDLRKWKKA